MQNYKPDLNDPVEITFSQLIEKINNNNESLRSNFSGETTPEDFCVGQLHYSTADKKLILKTEEGNFALMYEGSFTTDMIEETETREFITPEEKSKLEGIEASANNYTHPASHSADMIEETETREFITPEEKTKLAGIAEGANNYAHPETHSTDMIEETETREFITASKKNLIGKFICPIKNITNSYTMSIDDIFIIIRTDECITLVLPDATCCAGFVYIIKRDFYNEVGNTIINCVLNQKINNESSVQISSDEALMLISDGNNFFII